MIADKRFHGVLLNIGLFKNYHALVTEFSIDRK